MRPNALVYIREWVLCLAECPLLPTASFELCVNNQIVVLTLREAKELVRRTNYLFP